MNWDEATKHLHDAIDQAAEMYWSSGLIGYFLLRDHFLPLQRRLDRGERTRGLYDAIMRRPITISPYSYQEILHRYPVSG